MSAPARNGPGNSGRRKSFAFFARPSAFSEPEGSTWPSKDDSTQFNTRPKSALLFGGNVFTEVSAVIPSKKALMKSPGQRPKSMFGSLKTREPVSPTIMSSGSSSLESPNSDALRAVFPTNIAIIHAGEVVTGGGLLRKKKEYMVLTNRELLRYKSEHHAYEALGLGSRQPGRTSSVVLLNDMANEHALVTTMNQAVAIYYSAGDSEVDSSVQVDYLDGFRLPSSTSLTASTPAEAQVWVDRLRSISGQSRLSSPPPSYPDATVEHIARRLELENDYSPMHFQIFRVVQRTGKSGNRSVEDLQKLYSTMCYLAIGIHKVHLVPLKPMVNKGTNSFAAATTSFGILNLVGLWISNSDDSFSLTFRFPCRFPHKLSLASVYAPDIIQSLRQAAEYLRPTWQISPFSVDIPEVMKDDPLPDIPPTPGDDLNGFDRTLAAYCTAYALDASNIVYAVNMDFEDGPQFQLYPPAHARRRQYTDLELLAIMRTLRWNDTFCSISFRGISLDPLACVFDTCGTEYEPRVERLGRRINLKTASQGIKSLLVHELRALALYCGKLRRMDFYESIKRRGGSSGIPPADGANDGACSIVEAIMPLCRRGLTNVDWFDLTGIELREADLDWLVDAAASRLAHFRGFGLARCGLTERMLTLFLNALATHENTLEALDICGNPCRIHVPSINNALTYFPFLRKLNLSRLLRTSGEDPILTAETLHRWRLEFLDLSETKLNVETVEAIATYLASPQSDALQSLGLSQCNLSASNVALLMHSMQRSPGKARNLHLHVSRNPLAQDASEFVDCIYKNITPSHLTMRMVDYPKEESFQELIRALTVNRTLVYLDMAKISLPYEAGERTSAELENLFARNTTLRELDLSGEQAVLESASLGSGLLKPLGRIAENKSLEVLRIELQSLGTPGAMELASLLPKNTTLRELHCEMNEIHLQGFTAIVNAMEHNHTLVYLPRMDRDRNEQMRALKEKLYQPSMLEDRNFRRHSDKGGKRSSFGRTRKGRKVSSSDEAALSLVGIEQNLMLLEEKWESEVSRLQAFLARNVNIYNSHDRNKARRTGAYSSSSISGMGVLWGMDGK